jgi:hypothetical protein
VQLTRFSSGIFFAILSLTLHAQTVFHPGTTLTAEQSANTSAADSFPGQKNGNISGRNVSKVPTRTLLNAGSTAKLFAHLVPWFGFGNHVDIGYNSSDILQVQKQVADMISRGIDGVIIDWYGRATTQHHYAYDQAAQGIMKEAEQHPGFTFAIMADAGAFRGCEQHEDGDCSPTHLLINDLNYAFRTYENSPAYLQVNGHPVVLFFGQEQFAIDWDKVRNQVAGEPYFVFRNASGFTADASKGGYSWVSPFQAGQNDPSALGYLKYFYRAARQNGDSIPFGAAYKGFDDSIALWSQNRRMDQRCGQTWLDSVAEVRDLAAQGQDLFGIQLVTWNDYEEGTEIETGIDNCVSLRAWTRGALLQWKVDGNPDTLDHFTVFISQDGEHLMALTNLPASTTSLDLQSFGLPEGAYTAYVKAVGKPSLTNTMSEGERVELTSRSDGPALSVALSGTSGDARELWHQRPRPRYSSRLAAG